MIRKLRCKFILINMSIVTIMLLVILGMVIQSTYFDMETQSVRTMRSLLDDRRKPHSRPGEPTQAVQLPFFHVTLAPDGTILSLKGDFYDLTDTEALKQIINAATCQKENQGVLRSYNLRYLRQNTHWGQSIVFVDTSSEQATLSNLLERCIMIGLASFTAFLALSFYLAQWAVRPVESAWKQQKQFVADASHELKTPLTVIVTTAELLSEENCDAEQQPQMINSILTMSQQMRGLIDSLLELARVDAGMIKTAFAAINLSNLVSDTLLPFEPIYFEQGLQLESTITDNVIVKGSITHLKQVIEVFLDNALKYTTPGGCVMLTLNRQGNGCLLAVSSSGNPISKQDLKNIFRRFYRMDKARAMDHSYGLGLSIAETIVHQHNGKIWAESENGLNTFLVQLPTI